MEEMKPFDIYPVLWSLLALLARPERLPFAKSVGK
jgi:hypothetical protein